MQLYVPAPSNQHIYNTYHSCNPSSLRGEKLSSGGVLLNFTKMYQNLTLSLTQVTHNKFLLP